MNPCVVPFRCEACGFRGEITIDLAQYKTRKARLEALMFNTVEVHKCPRVTAFNFLERLTSLFWEWPPCWSSWEPPQ